MFVRNNKVLTMWKGVLLRKQAINTEMYILNPLKDKSHFTIMAGDHVTLLEISWWVTSSESSNHVVCSFVLFNLITVMISFP